MAMLILIDRLLLSVNTLLFVNIAIRSHFGPERVGPKSRPCATLLFGNTWESLQMYPRLTHLFITRNCLLYLHLILASRRNAFGRPLALTLY